MTDSGPPPTTRIDEALDAARAQLDRVEPAELAAVVEAGGVAIDIRPIDQRARDGHLAGAIVIDRNVLEWRLDPSSPYRIPEVDDPDLRFVVVCNQGYASSLAAATLRALGLARATDLAGGFQALLAAGLVPAGEPGPDRTAPVRRR